MTSADEAELGALFITAKKMIPIVQTLAEMHCPLLPSPLQTDNFTAKGVVNNTIVPQNIQSMYNSIPLLLGPWPSQLGQLQYRTLSASIP